jgi:outer membrane protein assembly factor BamB
MWAIRPGASGDISLREGETASRRIAWFRDDAGSHFTSPLFYQGLLYCFPAHADEPVSCFDAKTGATVYQQKIAGQRGFKASPVALDGKFFCTDESGTSFVLQAGPALRVLTKNELAELTGASPALAGGAIFLRTVKHLFCIAK